MTVESSTITPWKVEGKIEYNKLVDNFGTSLITPELIYRWEKLTKTKIHYLIRRGIVFSHQDLTKILDNVEKGIPNYIYTGRGPSSESMHLGHLVPFMLTKYLQDALNCIVIIQMSDDEKFLFKSGSTRSDLEYYHQLSRKNAKDIIAVGFDPDKTFIFSNMEFNTGDLYATNMIIAANTNMNQIKGIYGLGEAKDSHIETILKSVDSDCESTIRYLKSPESASSVGQCIWPTFQCGPAFCVSFRKIFSKAINTKINELKVLERDTTILKRILDQLSSFDKKNEMLCIVPMAIDQAPYFRMARDVAYKLDCEKPTVIYSRFLPPITGLNGKMSSSSGVSSTIFLDMDPTKISKIIKKYAYSGGCATKEEHMEKGGNIRVDMAYQYLTFFMDDDDKLKKIAEDYSNGTLLSGDLKKICAEIISNILIKHQTIKTSISDSIIDKFFDCQKTMDIGTVFDDKPELEEFTTNCGISFDLTFGMIPKSERKIEM
ncbi:MAG: tryptophan--tRNA ligase [Magnetococcales bacterium]|nr:tryptophan--tRNA ligase [Magnetococcales bacterium]|tara:strand:- start:10963 stop:12429 length:1467 start_codon:yes stop_codon:yes gene_type:complete